jgi:hypothetical protein
LRLGGGLLASAAVGLLLGGVVPAVADEAPVATCPSTPIAPLSLPPIAASTTAKPGDTLTGVGVGETVDGALVQAVHWLKDGAFYPPDTPATSTTPGASRVGPRSLTVGADDLGSTFSLVVGYSRYVADALCGPSLSLAGPVTVKAATRTTVDAPKSPSRITVTVKSGINAAPDGTVKVAWKGGSKSVPLKPSAQGKVRVSLPSSFPKDKTSVTVKFTDPKGRFTSSTKRLTVRVS